MEDFNSLAIAILWLNIILLCILTVVVVLKYCIKVVFVETPFAAICYRLEFSPIRVFRIVIGCANKFIVVLAEISLWHIYIFGNFYEPLVLSCLKNLVCCRRASKPYLVAYIVVWQNLILLCLEPIINKLIILVVKRQQLILVTTSITFSKIVNIAIYVCNIHIPRFFNRSNIWRIVIDSVIGRFKLAYKQIHNVLLVALFICAKAACNICIPSLLFSASRTFY